MSEVFGHEYGGAYDDLYQDKDYGEECRLIIRLLQTYGDGPVRNILDLGCGTGNHAFPLAQQGYQIVGVDRSRAMLDTALRKTTSQQIEGAVGFHEGDIRSFRIQQSFDATLMMFAVLGYQLENNDVLAALRNARTHLRDGGLFIFDAWYGPAVLRQGPNDRVKSIPTEKGQIIRLASGRLNVQQHLCTVRYHLWRLEQDRLAAETEESHRMRYFFPLELNLFLESCGFSPIRLGAFPEFDHDPDEMTWNVLGVARAI
jgi:SAM-dependent methyltransferase